MHRDGIHVEWGQLGEIFIIADKRTLAPKHLRRHSRSTTNTPLLQLSQAVQIDIILSNHSPQTAPAQRSQKNPGTPPFSPSIRPPETPFMTQSVFASSTPVI
jgi:hypothetical protein